jgi:hypothetical protein
MRPIAKYPADMRVEESMNRSGSSRPWTSRLLGLAMTFALCFTVAISPLQAQTSCAFADVNGDGVVDDADLLQVLFCFGTSTPLTIPDIDEMVAMRLTAAFPTHFPGAPDVPFNPQDAAFARTRLSTADSFFDVFVAWDTRADFWQFDAEQVARGLVVGAVYLPPGGEAPDGTLLPEGFYLVRMHSEVGQDIWHADLLDARTGRPRVVGLPAQASRTLRIPIPGTRNDIAIKVRPNPNNPQGFCVEIWLSYLCPNGVWLDQVLIWRRCFP